MTGSPNAATHAESCWTGFLSREPTTCSRHWLTVHRGLYTLYSRTAGVTGMVAVVKRVTRRVANRKTI